MNNKALSPVIAAIILIAVTVAVSIAVAAWTGTLGYLNDGKDGFNKEILEQHGFNVISAQIYNSGNKIVIEEPAQFLSYAKNCTNTIFIHSGNTFAFFIYDGTIFMYDW